MKNIKKLVAIILVIALTLSIFGGCSVTQGEIKNVPQEKTNNVDDVSTMAETLGEEIELKRTNNAGESLGRGRYKYTISFAKMSQDGKCVPLGSKPYSNSMCYNFVFRDGTTNIATITFALLNELKFVTGYGTELYYASDNSYLGSVMESPWGYWRGTRTISEVLVFYSDISNLCDLDFMAAIFAEPNTVNSTAKFNLDKNTFTYRQLDNTNYTVSNMCRLNLSVEDIQPPPTIDVPTQPTSPNTMYVGENKDISVKANLVDGVGDISYQWYKGDTAISGATTSIYNLSTLPVGTHKLKCKLSAANAEDVYTNEITVTVLAKPVITITQQPLATEFYIGQPKNLSVTATIANGQSALRYQWYNGTTAIVGATSATLDLSTLPVGNHNLKVSILSDKAVTVTSNIVIVKVLAKPVITITQQPTNKTITVGDNVTIDVVASVSENSKNLNYQWYKNNEPIDDSITNTLALDNFPFGIYDIKCKLTDGISTLYSDTVVLTVNDVNGETPEPTPTPTPPVDEPIETTNVFQQIITAIVNFFKSIFNWFINLFN